MIAGVEIENGTCDSDYALLGVVRHPKATTVCRVQHLTILAFAVLEISLGVSNFKVGDHAIFKDCIGILMLGLEIAFCVQNLTTVA